MRNYLLFIFLCSFASCQKELHFPVIKKNNPVPEKRVAAIVVSNEDQNEWDSIVFRYFTNKTDEVHFLQSQDSITRTYYYDAAGRLSKIEDEKAIYYTNNNTARAISFQYNSSGQLIKTLTDFTTVTGVPAYYNYALSGNAKKIIVYDTSYVTQLHDLGWANRVVYNTLSSTNYLVYDSAVFFNHSTGGRKTVASDLSYDGNNNATSVRENTYQDGVLSGWGVTTITSDKPATVFEALRKSLFRNLANWIEASSLYQDDNYHLFAMPGHMYKRISYKGYALYGGPEALTVLRASDFENEYVNNEIEKSKVSFSLTGQGNIHYINFIRYYYK